MINVIHTAIAVNKNYFTVADFTVYFFNKFLSGSGSLFTGSKVYLAE